MVLFCQLWRLLRFTSFCVMKSKKGSSCNLHIILYGGVTLLVTLASVCYCIPTEPEEDNFVSVTEQDNTISDATVSPTSLPANNMTDEEKADSFECVTKPSEAASGRQLNPSSTPIKKWSSLTFYASNNFDNKDLENVKSAIQTVHDLIPCVDMDLRIEGEDEEPSGDYVYLDGRSNECASYVGMQGGRQDTAMARWCVKRTDLILHEILHVLGLDHEHSRPDRDEYLDILWHNIRPDTEQYFHVNLASPTFGIPYNYQSLLHYSEAAFSITPDRTARAPTLRSKRGDKIGSVGVLQSTDKLRLQALYRCRGLRPRPDPGGRGKDKNNTDINSRNRGDGSDETVTVIRPKSECILKKFRTNGQNSTRSKRDFIYF